MIKKLIILALVSINAVQAGFLAKTVGTAAVACPAIYVTSSYLCSQLEAEIAKHKKLADSDKVKSAEIELGYMQEVKKISGNVALIGTCIVGGALIGGGWVIARAARAAGNCTIEYIKKY